MTSTRTNLDTVAGVERPGDAARAWGDRRPGGGRASHVTAVPEFQGTTFALRGLFPWVAGSGSPSIGIPIGRHMMWGEVVCLDPLEWLRNGLITNPGVFLLGQPGVGKSALAKRLIMGMAGCGTRILILGDTKPDYTNLIEYLGGQVIRVGRGLDRINPLDAGPLGSATTRMTGDQRQRLLLEVRGRRLSLLLALCALVRRDPLPNPEEVLLGRAIDLLTDRLDADPTIPDVLRLLEAGPDELRSTARAHTDGEYRTRTHELIQTLVLLCEGTLKGVFDGPTTRAIDLDAPAVSVDISSVSMAGDALVAAAMLSVWGYGFAVVDASAALAEQGLAPRRQYLGVMDELWRALRGSSGLVEHADALTRLNRQRGMASIMITHGLDDLDALRTEEDRKKARGFIERSAVKILAALDARELARVGQIINLTDPERHLVSGWASPEALHAEAVHPGRGKYLVKIGDRPGLPVSMSLIGDEWSLYNTDGAISAPIN